MTLYEEMNPLYMETDASVVGLGPMLLQTRKVKVILEMRHLTTIY